MKQNKTLIKKLRRELHFHQTMLRVDLSAVRAGVRKCKELGQRMRDLQSGAVEHSVQLTCCTDCSADVGDNDVTCPNCGLRNPATKA